MRNLMICCFIHFSWWLFSVPQYLINCIKSWKRLYLKFCLCQLPCVFVSYCSVLLSVCVGVASPSPWLSGHLLLVSLVSPALFPVSPLPISSFSLSFCFDYTPEPLLSTCVSFPCLFSLCLSLVCFVCPCIDPELLVWQYKVMHNMCCVRPWSSLMLFPIMFRPWEI